MNNQTYMRAVIFSLALLASAVGAFGNMIPIGEVPVNGNGLGAVKTSISFSNSNNNGSDDFMESGCVGIVGHVESSGSVACPVGFSGGDNSNPAAPSVKNQTFTAADLGFSDTVNFANIVLLFNAIESDQSITLKNVALTLFGDGLSETFYYNGPAIALTTLPGQGSGGYGFQLDATQASIANAFLAAHPTTRIGTAATASGGLSAGDESISLSTIDSVQPASTPEPATFTMTLGGAVLIGICMRRRFRSRTKAQ